MSIPAVVEPALAAVDAAGIYLRADNNIIRLRAGWSGLAAQHRDALRAHKPAVLALLRAHPRPDPDPVWFVRRNLAVFEVPLKLAGGQRHVWRSGRVYHRLTATVLAYLDAAVARRLPLLAPADRDVMLARCGPLSDYVVQHFRPDQWARAFADASATLPEPPCPVPS